MFAKVLVANRGEIAVRIFRTLRELGRRLGCGLLGRRPSGALHASYADEAFALGGLTAAESYLVVEKLLEAARALGGGGGSSRVRVPGRERRLRACGRGGRARLDRPAAGRDRADGVEDARPPGDAGRRASRSSPARPIRSARPRRSSRLGDEIGYPLLIKAAAGGGGKGMKVVRSADEAAAGLRVGAPRGAVVLRRSGSLRRAVPRGPAARRGPGARRRARQRHPPRRARLHDPAPPPEARSRRRRRRPSRPSCASGSGASRSTRRARRATARRGRSRGCSTPDGDYFFMEMNTRIQVEHTVTELVTGVDLVREQVLVAAGEPLSLRQEDVAIRGHAIECRINAEDPSNGLPAQPGQDHELPRAGRAGRARRLGRERRLGDQRPLRPDDREADRPRRRPRSRAPADAAGARRSSRSAASSRSSASIRRCSAIPASSPARRATASSSRELIAEQAARVPRSRRRERRSRATGTLSSGVAIAEVDGRRVEVKVLVAEPPATASSARQRRERAASARRRRRVGVVVSPMQGTVLDVKVADGDDVAAGEVDLHRRGDEDGERGRRASSPVSSRDLAVAAGAPVTIGQAICVIESPAP